MDAIRHPYFYLKTTPRMLVNSSGLVGLGLDFALPHRRLDFSMVWRIRKLFWTMYANSPGDILAINRCLYSSIADFSNLFFRSNKQNHNCPCYLDWIDLDAMILWSLSLCHTHPHYRFLRFWQLSICNP
jgi:hypothetical protein